MGVEASIHAALMGRVESLATSLAIAYPGAAFEDTGGDYLRVTHLRNTPVRWGIDGADPVRRMGILQIDLMTVPQGRSYQVVTDNEADVIIDHFPRGLVITRDGIRIYLESSYALSPSRLDAHWMTPIRIEYRAEA